MGLDFIFAQTYLDQPTSLTRRRKTLTQERKHVWTYSASFYQDPKFYQEQGEERCSLLFTIFFSLPPLCPPLSLVTKQDPFFIHHQGASPLLHPLPRYSPPPCRCCISSLFWGLVAFLDFVHNVHSNFCEVESSIHMSCWIKHFKAQWLSYLLIIGDLISHKWVSKGLDFSSSSSSSLSPVTKQNLFLILYHHHHPRRLTLLHPLPCHSPLPCRCCWHLNQRTSKDTR